MKQPRSKRKRSDQAKIPVNVRYKRHKRSSKGKYFLVNEPNERRFVPGRKVKFMVLYEQVYNDQLVKNGTLARLQTEMQKALGDDNRPESIVLCSWLDFGAACRRVRQFMVTLKGHRSLSDYKADPTRGGLVDVKRWEDKVLQKCILGPGCCDLAFNGDVKQYPHWWRQNFVETIWTNSMTGAVVEPTIKDGVKMPKPEGFEETERCVPMNTINTKVHSYKSYTALREEFEGYGAALVKFQEAEGEAAGGEARVEEPRLKQCTIDFIRKWGALPAKGPIHLRTPKDEELETMLNFPLSHTEGMPP